MSKAVLIMDMPSRCIECPCCRIGAFYDVCSVLQETTPCADNGKPDWCPLRPMPEKMDEMKAAVNSKYSYSVGYNACIDELTAGSSQEE